MKRIYLSGPMTGLPDLNFKAFAAEAARLRALGYEVVNPAEVNPDQSKTWHECMREDIRWLMTCDTLVLLPGWMNSQGAQLEQHLASRLGIKLLMCHEVQAPYTPAPATRPGCLLVDMDGPWALPGVGA